MFKVFIISFGIIALIWALLSAFTTIFYRNKYPEQLGHFQRNVLYGEASMGDRAMLFFGNLLFSYRFPPIYIIAGIITLIFWIISASSSQQVGKGTIDTNSSTQNINIENNISNASDTNEDTITYIYFKDGAKVPKYEFLNSCITLMNQKSGGFFDAKKVCPCLIEKLSVNFTSKEYIVLMKGEGNVENLTNFYNSEIGKKIISDCISSNINPNNNTKIDYPVGFRDLLVSQLKTTVQEDKEFCDLVDADKFCECLADKIMKIYTVDELINSKMSPMSPDMEKAREDCFKESLK